MSKPVFIIGGSHHNTLGVIRAFGEKGLQDNIELFISHNDKIITTSRYISKGKIHYFEQNDEIPDLVLEVARTKETKPIIISCGDPYIEVLDRDSSKLNPYCILPHGREAYSICKYLDKDYQRHLAEKTGLIMAPVYKSSTCIDIEQIEYPCIVKPLNSTKGSKEEIAVYNSESELKDFLSHVEQSHEIIIEKYIDKAAEFQLIGCSLRQKIIIPGYTNIIRQPANTNTGYLKYLPISDGFVSAQLIEKVSKFIRSIGYEGLFSMEFLRGKDGKDYFLEINMRNDGNAYCVTMAGVNLPYLWYKYADKPNLEITENLTFEHSVYWLPEADLHSITTIGVAKWLKQWCSADGHAYANLCDPMPFINYLYRLIQRRLTERKH